MEIEAEPEVPTEVVETSNNGPTQEQNTESSSSSDGQVPCSSQCIREQVKPEGATNTASEFGSNLVDTIMNDQPSSSRSSQSDGADINSVSHCLKTTAEFQRKLDKSYDLINLTVNAWLNYQDIQVALPNKGTESFRGIETPMGRLFAWVLHMETLHQGHFFIPENRVEILQFLEFLDSEWSSIKAAVIDLAQVNERKWAELDRIARRFRFQTVTISNRLGGGSTTIRSVQGLNSSSPRLFIRSLWDFLLDAFGRLCCRRNRNNLEPEGPTVSYSAARSRSNSGFPEVPIPEANNFAGSSASLSENIVGNLTGSKNNGSACNYLENATSTPSTSIGSLETGIEASRDAELSMVNGDTSSIVASSGEPGDPSMLSLAECVRMFRCSIAELSTAIEDIEEFIYGLPIGHPLPKEKELRFLIQMMRDIYEGLDPSLMTDREQAVVLEAVASMRESMEKQNKSVQYLEDVVTHESDILFKLMKHSCGSCQEETGQGGVNRREVESESLHSE